MAFRKVLQEEPCLLVKSPAGSRKIFFSDGLRSYSLNERPVLSLVDGHKAHVTAELIEPQ